MTPKQIAADLDKLVRLNDQGQLTQQEHARIRDILFAHYKTDYDVRTLYKIIGQLKPRHLKAIGIILLNHKVFLKCGICGRPVTTTGHYRIDHTIPTSTGGGNTSANLQHSHNICNLIKDDRTDLASFYDHPVIVAEYIQSETYMILKGQIQDVKKAIEKPKQPRMRPGRANSHHFNNIIYHNNRSQRPH